MRSTNQIMIAVSECEPCTDEELRYCIAALKSKLYFATKAADDMSEGIEGSVVLKHQMSAKLWANGAEGRFKGIKMPVDKYLGPGNIPGSPEQIERLEFGKQLVKKVTGIDL